MMVENDLELEQQRLENAERARERPRAGPSARPQPHVNRRGHAPGGAPAARPHARPVTSPGRPRVCIVRQRDVYEPQVQRVAEALVGAGYDVEVLCMRHPDRPRTTLVNGVRVTGLPGTLARTGTLRYLWDYASFFALVAGTLTARHLRRRYAAVQVYTMPDVLVFAAAIPKLLGSRVVAYMNEPTPELFETLYGTRRLAPVLRLVEQRVLRFADHAITVTEDLKRRFVERGAQGERIAVVLDAADPASGLANWTPPRARPGGVFTAICHGAIEDRYGHDTIVEAARLLRDELPDLRVVFTGRGSTAEALERLIEESGMGDVVSFEGWVSRERLNDLLHTADVGIVAQKASPYSHLVHTYKMVDYWIFGLPVVAGRLRAVSALYDESVLELFEPGDARDLARALRRLHDDHERRDELARNGRAAQRRYGWETQRRVYLGVYERLLRERPQAAEASRRAPAAGLPPRPAPEPERPPAPTLERLLQPLGQVDVDAARGSGPPAWLRAGRWRLLASPRADGGRRGELIERFTLGSGVEMSAGAAGRRHRIRPLRPRRGLCEVRHRVVARARAGQGSRAPAARCLLPPQAVPPRRRAARRAARARPGDRSARVPDLAARAWSGPPAALRRALPARSCGGRRSAVPVVLAGYLPRRPRPHARRRVGAGLRRALELADLEQERGLRSSFNIVGDDHGLDMGVARELQQRGFEVGLHGLQHDASLFATRAGFVERLPRLAEAAQRMGAIGFQSPATHRVPGWLHELPFAYDTSVPHSDPYEPRPGAAARSGRSCSARSSSCRTRCRRTTRCSRSYAGARPGSGWSGWRRSRSATA